MIDLLSAFVEWIPYVAYPILAASHAWVAFASVTRYSFWFSECRARRRDRMLFASKNIYLSAGFLCLMLARAFANIGNANLDSLMLDGARAAFLLAAIAMLSIVIRSISYGRKASSQALQSAD